MQYLFELIVCDVFMLQKVMFVGVKFGINIVLEYLYSDSFKEDMYWFKDVLFVYYFYIVLEIIECDMFQQYEVVKLFEWLYFVGFEIVIDDFGIGYSVLIYLE